MDVTSSTGVDEAMTAPAVSVAPVGPWTYAEKDAVIEVAGPVETAGGAGVRWVFVIAVGTDRRRTANTDHDLGVARRHTRQRRSYSDCTKKYFQSAHLEPLLRLLRKECGRPRSLSCAGNLRATQLGRTGMPGNGCPLTVNGEGVIRW